MAIASPGRFKKNGLKRVPYDAIMPLQDERADASQEQTDKAALHNKDGGKMASRAITGRVVAFLVVGFLLLVAVPLLWQGAEEGPSEEKSPSLRVTTVKIEGQEAEELLEGEDSSARDALRDLERRELERQLKRLKSGDIAERRDAAFRLVFIADRSCTVALLAGLKDADPKVAERCAKALTRLWRTSHSPAAQKLLESGLAAYEAGRADEALQMFTKAGELDDDICELYRLRAEIWLDKSRPDQALDDCKRAISVEKNNFHARYLAALCYLEMGDHDKAMQSVTESLSIYPHFEQARALQERIRQLRRTPAE